MTALSSWRDAAVILLLLEAFILALLVGAALYLAWRGLRQFQGWLVPYLLLARTRTRRFREGIVRVMQAVRAPFIGLHSLRAGLRRAAGILQGR